MWQSNQVRIGNANVTSIGGQVGWTTFSDGRFKKNIKEDIKGLDFINKLRPVRYNVDVKGLKAYISKNIKQDSEATSQIDKAIENKATEEAANIVQDGFVAQEVEKAATELGFEFSGVDKPKSKDGLYGLRYDNFVVPLVKAVQELSKENEDLKNQNAALENRLEKLEALITNQSAVSSQQLTVISSALLEQNAPNPFSHTTSISYVLPAKFHNAQMVIKDINGKIIKQVKVSGAGKGVVQVDASTLSSGTYTYSLIIDGKIKRQTNVDCQITATRI